MERMTVMMKDNPMLSIELDGLNIRSTIINEEAREHLGLKAILPESINIKVFDAWLRYRLPDPTRDDIDLILKKYDVPDFLPYQMCKKSHGIRIQDFFWIKWEGEQVTYNDIRIR